MFFTTADITTETSISDIIQFAEEHNCKLTSAKRNSTGNYTCDFSSSSFDCLLELADQLGKTEKDIRK